MRYETLVIKNFKRFKDLTVPNLTNINLISGKNKVGKTSLLEAIYVHGGAGTPEIKLWTYPLSDIRPFWVFLFNDYDMRKTIEIHSQKLTVDDVLFIRNVEDEKEEILEELSKYEAFPYRPETSFLLETYQQCSLCPDVISYYTVLYERGTTSQPRPSQFPVVFLRFRSIEKLSQSYYKLYTDDFMNYLRIITEIRKFDANIYDVKILDINGMPLLYIEDKEGLTPIYYESYSELELLNICLGMYEARNGVLLIDNEDSLFHHSQLEAFWKLIDNLADMFKVQVFITTQSYELITYASKVFKDSNKLNYYRLDENSVKVFDSSELQLMVELGMEIR